MPQSLHARFFPVCIPTNNPEIQVHKLHSGFWLPMPAITCLIPLEYLIISSCLHLLVSLLYVPEELCIDLSLSVHTVLVLLLPVVLQKLLSFPCQYPAHLVYSSF